MKNVDFWAAPNADRPLLIVRLRAGHEVPEVWNPLFEELKKSRAICDELWFATGIGFPTLEEHRQKSAWMAEYAAELRKAGIIPSLQIQATIGHGDRTIADNSIAGLKWGTFVGCSGAVTRTCNCPAQPGFLEYMAEMSRIYAQWHPGSVWIDDDLRLSGHSPAFNTCGCYCDDCIAAFNAQEGTAYDRAGLVAACDADPELQQRWHKRAIGTLTKVAQVIVENFKKYSPETRFGLQHGGGLERIEIIRAMADAAGTRVGSRPGGGASSDHIPYRIVDKAFLCARQQFNQWGYETVDQICPEIETYPRNFCCKTAQGIRFETMLYLALGADSMTYFMMDPVCETPQWYGENLLAPLAADAPCFRKLILSNAGTLPGGMGLPHKDMPFSAVEQLGLPLIGIPQAGYSPQASCVMLTEEHIDKLSDDEIRQELKRNAILDGNAALALVERGLGAELEGIVPQRLTQTVFDYCTGDALCQDLEGAKHFPFSEDRVHFVIPDGCDVRVLTRYMNQARDCSLGEATVVLNRKDGSRIALVGYAGFHTTYVSTSWVKLLNRIVDCISGNKLPVLALDATQCLIVPRATADGSVRTVTVLNTTIGKHRPFRMALRNVPEACQVKWCVPSEDEVTLELTRNGNDVIVTVPEIMPWNAGFLAVE